MESYNLINANIITLQTKVRTASSITIDNGKIEALDKPNSNYKTLDMRGATIIPGFIDAHFHLKNYGKRLDMLNLKNKVGNKEISYQDASAGLGYKYYDEFVKPTLKSTDDS